MVKISITRLCELENGTISVSVVDEWAAEPQDAAALVHRFRAIRPAVDAALEAPAALELEPKPAPAALVNASLEPAQIEPQALELEPEPAAPRRPDWEGARAELQASLPPRPPKPTPRSPGVVRVEVPLPSPAKTDGIPTAEKPRRKQGPRLDPVGSRPEPSAPGHANGIPATPPGGTPTPRQRSGRELWEQIKDIKDKLDWHVALGKKRGWPALIVNWSAGMVAEARAAWLAPDKPMWNDRKPA